MPIAENTLLKYFFSSESDMDPEKRFNLTRKSRVRRMREILGILQHYHFLRGFQPIEFRRMLEDLGPSFVKIGQTLSTRSEILPKAFCEELAKLQAECDPLPFDEILDAIHDIYGDEQGEIFDAIDPKPLGSVPYRKSSSNRIKSTPHAATSAMYAHANARKFLSDGQISSSETLPPMPLICIYVFFSPRANAQIHAPTSNPCALKNAQLFRTASNSLFFASSEI